MLQHLVSLKDIFGLIIYPIMKSYLTESEAINDLRNRGFRLDFNKVFKEPLFRNQKIPHFLPSDKFKIVEIHRFEGESNPDDEAIVFAIESNEGYKGILLNGYGVSANSLVGEFVKKLALRG